MEWRKVVTIEDIVKSLSQLMEVPGYSIEEITEKIGKNNKVSTLNYECLEPKLKELVNEGNIDLKMAILVHIIFNKKENAPERENSCYD